MEVLDAIVGGQTDDLLTQIENAVKQRRQIFAQRNAAALVTGDKIRVVGNIKPRYLVGLVGTVVRVNTTTITMDFDDPTAAGRFGRGVRMPITCVEAI